MTRREFSAVRFLLRLAASMAVTVAAFDGVRAQVANQQAPIAPTQTFEGILGVVWGDPHPDFGSASAIRYTLTLPDGRILPLNLGGLESEAVAHFGQRVAISGRAVQTQAAVPGVQAVPAIEVSGLAPSSMFQAEPAAGVLGTKRVIYLLVKFTDDAAVPHPPAFFTDMTNPDTPPAGAVFPSTLNGFFKKTSNNQFSWIGDVGGVGGVGASGGWLTLPHPKSFYAPCGWSSSCANLSALSDDATALGRAQGINFKIYDNINFVLSNDLDCCAWGGGYFSSVDSKSYGATWEPPWGQNAGTYAHEMGHSIGLPHSGWTYYAYDSPWDVMSSIQTLNGMACGSYLSINNAGTTGRHAPRWRVGYIAAQRDFLGWIPSASQVVTDTGSSATVTIEGSALPLGSAIKLIKICFTGSPCTGSTAHYLTVEARVKGLGAASQFDNAIPGEGVIIHDVRLNRSAIGGSCYFNSQSGWAVPIDATPGDYDSAACNFGGRGYPNYGLYNAQWVPGQTYNNGFKISVVSRSGSTFVVSIVPLAVPPAVTTGSALSVTTTTATLNGTVNPNGVATTASFQYGLTASYGSSTPAQAMGSGSAALAIGGGAITGLACNTQYHFRATATSVNGTTAGLDATFTTAACRKGGDFDSDGKADIAFYRPSSGTWFVDLSGSNYTTSSTYTWGVSSDIPVSGDYDGDGLNDVAVFRPSTGVWYILKSSTNFTTYAAYTWGTSGDKPVPGDYDGDGTTDVAIYRPSTGTWWVLQSSSNFTTSMSVAWGTAADLPVPADYDGDGRSDIAVFRPSSGAWWVLQSSANFSTAANYAWGTAGDLPLPGDYDGDGKADIAVYRPSTGTWFVLQSTTHFTTYLTIRWGVSTDVPIPGDFDGDGKADIVVYRPSTGAWFILQSSSAYATYFTTTWGTDTDIPLPKRPD